MRRVISELRVIELRDASAQSFCVKMRDCGETVNVWKCVIAGIGVNWPSYLSSQLTFKCCDLFVYLTLLTDTVFMKVFVLQCPLSI